LVLFFSGSLVAVIERCGVEIGAVELS
jgi:hypothetical protein